MKKAVFYFVAIFFVFAANAQSETNDGPFKRPDATKPADTVRVLNNKNSLSNNKRKFDIRDMIIEPNFQLAIYQGQYNVGLAPYLGYRVWKNLYLGAGVSYYYTGIKGIAQTSVGNKEITANFHTVGGGVFAQYNIWKGFFARARFDVLHRKLDDINNAYEYPVGSGIVKFDKINRTYPILFLGAGYNIMASKNIFIPFMIQYNVLNTVGDQRYKPYKNGLVVQLAFVSIF